MKSNNPLSSTEVGRSILLTIDAKRIFRGWWVLSANILVAWAMFTRIRSSGFPDLDFQLCFEFVFEVALPVIGIVLEFANWKYARYMNVGCFACAGSYWFIAAVWDHSDPFFGVLLIMAIGLLAIAGLTEVVYRVTKSDAVAK